jgi:hypothetical protein
MTDDLYVEEKGSAWLRPNTLLPQEGRGHDFIGATLGLVSHAGRYLIGQTIVVDGCGAAK